MVDSSADSARSSVAGRRRAPMGPRARAAALVRAAESDDAPAVQRLLEERADPNVVSDAGQSALHIAASEDHVGVARMLLTAGADLELADRAGARALHLAVHAGSEAGAGLLLRMNANVNQTDGSGRTALHVAVQERQGQLVELLLAQGADVGARDVAGREPADLQPTPAILARLDEAKAKKRWVGADATTAAAGRAARRRQRAGGAAARDAAPRGRAGESPVSSPLDGAGALRTAAAATSDTDEAAPRPTAGAAARRRRREAAAGAASGSAGAGAAAGPAPAPPPAVRADGAGPAPPAPPPEDGRAHFDLVLVYAHKGGRGAAERAEGRAGRGAEESATAPNRAELVRRLRRVGLAVKKVRATESDGAEKVLVVVGASLARLQRAAEQSRLRLRLRAEYGGGFTPFRQEIAHMFEPSGHGEGDGARFFQSSERALLIERVLSAARFEGGAGLDMGALLKRGSLQRVYLLHDEAERQGLEARLGEGSMIGADPLPLRRIEGYLGPEYAFYFAFLFRLSKGLWLPAGLGVVLFSLELGVSTEAATLLTPLYALVLMLWATGFVETWKRRQNALAAEWDVADQQRRAGVRAEFEGDFRRGLYSASGDFVPVADEEMPADVEAPLLEMVESSLPRTRVLCSSTIITVFLGVTVVCTLALLAFRFFMATTVGTGGVLLAATLNAAFIEVMGYTYDYASKRLTDWENHRTYASYRDHLIVKLSAFSFFNKFFAIFYIAFGKGRRNVLFGVEYNEPCTTWAGEVAESCMDELRLQVLVLVLVHATVAQAVESAKPFYTYRKAKAREAQRAADGLPPEPRAARQLRLTKAEPLYYEYNELALDFATATLFATAFPVAPLIVLVNNFVEMRVDMLKVLRLRERPVVHVVEGIGMWLPIFDGIGYLAVFTNLAILAFTSRHLDSWVELDDAGKLLLLIAIEHAVILGKVGLAALVPDVPSAVLNAIAKRQWLARVWAEGERPALSTADGWRAAEDGDDVAAAGSDADSDGEAHHDDHDERAAADAEHAASALSSLHSPDARGASAAARGFFGGALGGGLLPPSPASPRSPGSTPLARSASAFLPGGGPWSPYRALAARRSPRQCTDVLCVLLLLLAVGGLLTLSTVAFIVGRPEALHAGFDHGFDLCGTAQPALQVDGRLLVDDANARAVAPVWSAGADRTATPLLFFADPAAHLGICVSECPRPARTRDGFEPGALVCTDACAARGDNGRRAGYGRCCFPAYATAERNGYCAPEPTVFEADLRHAWGGAKLERRFWPSDAGLERVRAAASSAGKGFADTAADLRASWEVILACSVGALTLSVLLSALLTIAPVGTTLCALLVALVALGCLTGTLWALGEALMREHLSAPDSAEFRYGYALAVSGYMCLALTVGATLGAFYAASTLVQRIGGAMAEVGRPLRDVPALQGLPALGLLASLCALLWWFWTAVHLASAGRLLVSSRGFPLPTFDSPIVRALGAHCLAGVFLLSLAQHVLRVVAAGLASVWYFRASLPEPHDASVAAADGGGARPRGFDESAQRMLLPELSVSSVLSLVARYHFGSVVFGSVALPLLMPLRLLGWLFRPCRLGATSSAERGDPDPLSSCCAATSLCDGLFALTADAYVLVVCSDLGLLPATRATWSHQLHHPGVGVAHAQQTVDICFFACARAIAARGGSAAPPAGARAPPSGGCARPRRSARRARSRATARAQAQVRRRLAGRGDGRPRDRQQRRAHRPLLLPPLPDGRHLCALVRRTPAPSAASRRARAAPRAAHAAGR